VGGEREVDGRRAEGPVYSVHTNRRRPKQRRTGGPQSSQRDSTLIFGHFPPYLWPTLYCNLTYYQPHLLFPDVS